MHLTDRAFPSPEAAPAFCMLLRKELGDRRVEGVEQLPGERIVRLWTAPRPGEASGPSLVIELFGPGGNVLVLDGEGRVLESLRPKLARPRGLPAGAVYAPPPPVAGGRAFALREFAEFSGDYNARVDAFYADRAVTGDRERKRARLLHAIRREIKRRTKLLADVAAERARCAEHEAIRRRAEVLVASIHALPARAARVTVLDFDGAEMTVELDPRYSVAENADRLFKKARRLARSLVRLDETERLARDELPRLAAWEDRATRAETAETVATVAEEAGNLLRLARSGNAETGKRADSAPAGPRRFRTGDGFEVLVGRDERENDHLTLRVARGNDYFLHVHGYPGSHVILRLGSNGSLTETALLDAAHLAVHYSKLRDAGGDVVYTRCKNVRKPKGAAPGKVAVTQERTIRVRVQKDRIERLFRTRGPGDQGA
jgi:predicted ribosome quality control (RQC) complex YloA/Tae2 family protein